MEEPPCRHRVSLGISHQKPTFTGSYYWTDVCTWPNKAGPRLEGFNYDSRKAHPDHGPARVYAVQPLPSLANSGGMSPDMMTTSGIGP